ncbi:imidazolonepropionase [Sediminivirga luteola]|uniref:Imidazolonepropionase n=1 Tax=Sediminivirga luteola TaxID=1774748 RepID=A0A8J2TV82_9MICO|nr:imidazolonepropionase [Sediminivirga luteola]MCI2264657.1 imidazolonepropionase [Sediminivirga luteola]GGA02697.1 imidazolonepropionase [Sediminivirga luteola]
MSTLITGIAELTTQDPERRVLHDAAIIVDGDRIAWLGSAAKAPAADERVDAGGRAMLPGWVDSHTHMVFAGDRSAEFEARMAGQSYAAGGINVTTRATREAGDEQLAALLRARIAEAVRGGTTYLETKTGYGLDVAEEARHARIAAGEVDAVTFLGAHLVPAGADAGEYTDLVCGPMLAAVRPYAQWADVFCERGAFDEEQSRRVLLACREAGLGLRVHGNQLGPGPGVRIAVEVAAASVDHVNHLEQADVDALAGSWTGWDRDSAEGEPGTVATCLPACDLSTREPLAPGRLLLDAGVEVALASNCNPGTSYTTSMNFCVGTAVLQMGLSLDEAVRAGTYGGALALRAQDEVGSIEVGKRADLHLLQAPAAIHLAYRPGMPLTHAVWRAGKRIV